MSSPVTVPLTWNSYVQAVANLAVMNTVTVGGVVQGVDTSFNTLMPQACNYAEERLQRDLDLQASLTSNAYNLTPANNILSISINDFVTIQTLAVNSGGVIYPLNPVSKEYIQNVFNTAASTGRPVVYAMIGGDSSGGNTSNNIMVGPYPDSAYTVSVMGTVRLPSLYLSANTTDAGTATTFISTNLPDLFIQASMILVSQFQRDFGAGMGNDEQMPGSYESVYQTLLKGALVEEARKKFYASGWSSMAPPLVASPSRG